MQLLKGTSALFFAMALSAPVSAVTGIWIRNILGPEQYGIWLVFSMIFMYGYYMHLGILDGFSRDIPRLLGEKKSLQAHQLRHVVFTWMTGSGMIAIAFMLLILWLPFTSLEKILGIMAFALIPVQNIALFHNQLHLTTQKFNHVAVIQLIIGSLQYVLMALLALLLGIYGLFLGVLIGNALAIMYSSKHLPYKLRLLWDGNVLKKMLPYGLPIMLIGLLTSLLTTLDRLLVYSFFGAAAAGHYGIIAFVYQGIMVLPGVFHQIMYPKINYMYGKTKKKRHLKHIILRPVYYMAFVSPFFLGTLLFVFPPFAAVLMPEYKEGIDLSKGIIAGLFFWLWAPLFAQYLIGVDRQWTYVKILIGAVLINAGTTILLTMNGFDMEGAAAGLIVSLICCSFLVMRAVLKDMGETLFYFLKCAAAMIHPFILMVLLVWCVQLLPAHFLVQSILFCAGYSFILIVYSYFVPPFKKARRLLISRLGKQKKSR
ncbi:oligosaccharide flippase family protein [Domibacillus indicus]|uniref:oligosaccharide flippase family protein n=1 Tax=Domibacillus indicus TaxID=1437523 RepID=UPI00203ED4D6|nr:oligosaccharide flippase family protein [Domibacillus indicus]MCM3790363.1 oligosaccharide flippase family protein [Domibacillus indicus]